MLRNEKHGIQNIKIKNTYLEHFENSIENSTRPSLTRILNLSMDQLPVIGIYELENTDNKLIKSYFAATGELYGTTESHFRDALVTTNIEHRNSIIGERLSDFALENPFYLFQGNVQIINAKFKLGPEEDYDKPIKTHTFRGMSPKETQTFLDKLKGYRKTKIDYINERSMK